MKLSLIKKLSLGFLAAVLGSIILASIISNLAIGKQFKDYLVDEHKSKVNSAVNLINDLYSTHGNLSYVNTDEIQRYAELQELYIEVKDTQDNVLYSSGSSYLKHNRMMKNRMGGMKHNFSGMDTSLYSEDKYPLKLNNKNVGTITIGYFGTSFLSSASINFLVTLNHSFIVSAIISLAFGLTISIIISKQLARPLLKITETANKMRDGNLDVKALVKTNTIEIAELSSSINYLAETLNSQEMLRKRLTSDVAHELRTPLTTLKTHVEAFIDGVWEATPERLEVFHEEIERLIKMVDQLRDLELLEHTSLKLNKSEVNLSCEIEKVIESFRPLFLKANYDLTSSIIPNLTTVTDIDKLKQIMNNLLSNSYKSLNENGKAHVELS